MSAIPYIGAAIGMVCDRHEFRSHRRTHSAHRGAGFIAAVGFTASAFVVSPVPGMIALTIAAIGDLGSRGPFWSLPGRFLTSSASAGGIALINTIGSLGGFVGPYAVGLVKERNRQFHRRLVVSRGVAVHECDRDVAHAHCARTGGIARAHGSRGLVAP